MKPKYYAAACVTSFIVCGVVSLFLGQDNNWDLRNYHYYNAYAFLTGRIGFDVAPSQLQSYLNPLLDIPYYLGSTYLTPRLFAFLMGGVHGLNFLLLFAIAFVVFREAAPNLRLGLSILCASFGLSGPVFIAELGGSFNDTLTSFFVTGSVYLILRIYSRHESLPISTCRIPLLASGAILGLGVGLKLTMMIYATGVIGAFLVVERTWRSRSAAVGLWGAGLLIGFVITNGFWMWILWRHFENPVFPFYNNIFRSPWAQLESYADRRYLPKTVWEGVARPLTFLVKCDYTDQQNGFRTARYAVFFTLFVSVVTVWMRRRLVRSSGQSKGRDSGPPSRLPKAELFLLVFFVVSFVVWESRFSIMRYTAGIELLAPTLIVVLVHHMIRAGRKRGIAIAAAFVMMAVSVRPMKFERVRFHDTYWDVAIPRFDRPERAVIVIANDRPWSYLIPLFPPEIRWVRVKGNHTDPQHDTKLQEEIRRVLSEGDLYLLSRPLPSIYYALDANTLNEYGLSRAAGHTPIISRYDEFDLALWRLQRDGRNAR